MSFNKKIMVKITNHENTWEEEAEDEVSNWEDLVALKEEFTDKYSFDYFVRPLKIKFEEVPQYFITTETPHFISQYIQALYQANGFYKYLPDWVENDHENLEIEVYHI